MQDRLSIKNVYESAFLYVIKHIFAFIFLVAFYYLGNLLPIFIGTTSFKLLMIPYYYLFLYFAAGCYYKQQILWDRHIFLSAGLRFLTAILLFLAAILISNFTINLFLEFLRASFTGGSLVVKFILHSTLWQIVKYTFIFMLFIVFFVIPSFAFVSEITGKGRSILTTYAKTKDNIFRIGFVALVAFVILLCTMFALRIVPPLIAQLVHAFILVFITIVYFTIYDFFYILAQPKTVQVDTNEIEPENKEQEILLASRTKNKKKV